VMPGSSIGDRCGTTRSPRVREPGVAFVDVRRSSVAAVATLRLSPPHRRGRAPALRLSTRRSPGYSPGALARRDFRDAGSKNCSGLRPRTDALERRRDDGAIARTAHRGELVWKRCRAARICRRARVGGTALVARHRDLDRLSFAMKLLDFDRFRDLTSRHLH
jgi:hypothetical protein